MIRKEQHLSSKPNKLVSEPWFFDQGQRISTEMSSSKIDVEKFDGEGDYMLWK